MKHKYPTRINAEGDEVKTTTYFTKNGTWIKTKRIIRRKKE